MDLTSIFSIAALVALIALIVVVLYRSHTPKAVQPIGTEPETAQDVLAEVKAALAEVDLILSTSRQNGDEGTMA